MYVSSAVIRTKSLHADNQGKADIPPSSYDVPLQREGMTSLRKEDSSSESSDKIHYNQAASSYEVPETMQRNQTIKTLERKGLSSLGMPNVDPMELDLPVSDFMKSSDVIFYLFSFFFYTATCF